MTATTTRLRDLVEASCPTEPLPPLVGRAGGVPGPAGRPRRGPDHRRRRLDENLGALAVRLDAADLTALSSLVAAGDRVEDRSWVERDTVTAG